GFFWDAPMAAMGDAPVPVEGGASVRMLSGGSLHGALPLGAALATAAAVRLRGGGVYLDRGVRAVGLGHASGNLSIDIACRADDAAGADVETAHDALQVEWVSVTQTGRRIMAGELSV